MDTQALLYVDPQINDEYYSWDASRYIFQSQRSGRTIRPHSVEAQRLRPIQTQPALELVQQRPIQNNAPSLSNYYYYHTQTANSRQRPEDYDGAVSLQRASSPPWSSSSLPSNGNLRSTSLVEHFQPLTLQPTQLQAGQQRAYAPTVYPSYSNFYNADQNIQTVSSLPYAPTTNSQPHSDVYRGNEVVIRHGPISVTSDSLSTTTSELDPGYRVIDAGSGRNFFKPGKVFRALWPEPAGESDPRSGSWTQDSQFGERIATKIRWFVVFQSYREHCVALSINTYGGRGETKPGIDPKDLAALVVQGGSYDQTEYRESMTKAPIHLILEDLSLRIDPASRIDFSRAFTVEYYVKVKAVGRLAPEDLARFNQYVTETLWKGKGNPPHNEASVVRQEQGDVLRHVALPMATASDTDEETLTEQFRAKPSKFFVVGRVFSALWVEPLSSGVSSEGQRHDGMPPTRFGETGFAKIRKFVVVRASNTYCNALAILSYDRRGVAKTHVTKSEHGIIYTGKSPPPPLLEEIARPGEDAMQPYAVRVIADDPSEKLDLTSRINYGKIYSVEHNLKVRNIGQVHRKSESQLLWQWKNVWELPSHPPKAASLSQIAGKSSVLGRGRPSKTKSEVHATDRRTLVRYLTSDTSTTVSADLGRSEREQGTLSRVPEEEDDHDDVAETTIQQEGLD